MSRDIPSGGTKSTSTQRVNLSEKKTIPFGNVSTR